MLDRICLERPELHDGVPMGMYHCGACGCMCIAGIEHPPHDVGCWLGEYDADELESIRNQYDAGYARVLDRTQPPRGQLSNGLVWVWMGSAPTPHWAIRGTGYVMPGDE